MLRLVVLAVTRTTPAKMGRIIALAIALLCSGVASLEQVKDSRTFQLKSPIRTPFHASGTVIVNISLNSSADPHLFFFPCFLVPRPSLSQLQENDIVMKLLSRAFPLFLQKTSWLPCKNPV
jgi:hypothetical protein